MFDYTSYGAQQEEMPLWAMVLGIAIIVFLIASAWKIYTKAGKPGWAVLIPFYNVMVLMEIVGKPVWWFLLYFVPVVNIFVHVIVVHRLAKSFGKDIAYTLGLLFLNGIFIPLLAFSNAKYVGIQEGI